MSRLGAAGEDACLLPQIQRRRDFVLVQVTPKATQVVAAEPHLATRRFCRKRVPVERYPSHVDPPYPALTVRPSAGHEDQQRGGRRALPRQTACSRGLATRG